MRTSKEDLLWPIYEFRLLPSEEKEHDWLRYDNGKWIPDDGEYGLAFVHLDDFPTCLMVELPYRRNILWSWVERGNWLGHVWEHPNGNPWHYMLREKETDIYRRWDRDKHTNIMVGREGMSFINSKRGCANGKHITFTIHNAHIEAGLLRHRDTKEVVKFPDIFNCIYCGEIDWRKREETCI